MASYCVRPATTRDLSAVRALERRVRRTGRRSVGTVDGKAVASSDGVWVVEATRGEIVGCCGVREDSCGAWRLLVLYLAPEWRGFGLGRSLLTAAVRHVRECGGLSLSLDNPGEHGEAVELTRRFGFVPGPKDGDRTLTLVLGQPS